MDSRTAFTNLPFPGSEQESVRPPYFAAFSVFRYSRAPSSKMPGRACRLHSWAVRWDLGSWLRCVQRRPTVERPQGRRADLPISIEPGFFVASLAPPQRTSAGRSPPKENWLGRKDANPSWNQCFTSHQRRLWLRLRMPSQLPATPRCWSPVHPDHQPTAKRFGW